MTKTVGGRRVSHHITKQTTQGLFRGVDFATATGQAFNTYVVVNLRDDAHHDPALTFGKVLHKYRDWLAWQRKKTGEALPLVYLYTLENPNRNPHANWVLRVPPGLEAEFERKLARWVERSQGAVGPYDIHIQPVVVGYVKRLAKYVVKGTDRRCVRHFYLEDVYAPQGMIVGRRTGISRSIGAKARKVAKFHPGKRRPYIPTTAQDRTQPAQAPARANG
jgi:hypothetical protein